MDVPGCGNTRNTSKAIKKRLNGWELVKIEWEVASGDTTFM